MSPGAALLVPLTVHSYCILFIAFMSLLLAVRRNSYCSATVECFLKTLPSFKASIH